MQNKVRIISGAWRGRKINFPEGEGLRPTPDRIRETLFNWLMPYILDATCLELFAGSGAIGFEALSRGAKSVTFVDSNEAVIKQLKANKAVLHAENALIKQLMIPAPPTFVQAQFDLIFIDPPYNQGYLAKVIPWVCQNNLVKANTLIYIENEAGLDLLDIIPKSWEFIKSKQTRTIAYSLVKVKL